MGSSQIRDRTHNACIGRRISNQNQNLNVTQSPAWSPNFVTRFPSTYSVLRSSRPASLTALRCPRGIPPPSQSYLPHPLQISASSNIASLGMSALRIPPPDLAGVPLVAQMIKNPPAMWETWIQPLGWEDPLEKDMATHSSILAWRIPWTEEPGRLQSMGSQRVRHD